MYAVIYYGMVINIRKKKQKIVKEYAKYMFGDSLLEVEWWRKPNLNTLREEIPGKMHLRHKSRGGLWLTYT